jgi:hypothetical protein
MFQKQPISITEMNEESNVNQKILTIVDVLTILACIGPWDAKEKMLAEIEVLGVEHTNASTHAEFRIANEAGPLVILQVGRKSVAKNQPTWDTVWTVVG